MDINLVILGANGMLGNTLFRYFNNKKHFKTLGIVRNIDNIKRSNYLFNNKKNISQITNPYGPELKKKLISFKTNVVINCIGIIKQNPESDNAQSSIYINSLLPHYLSNICRDIDARFIHVSTDCVFSGAKGNYIESDYPDANDLYGRTKYLGEVLSDNSITLRGSYIGKEIDTSRGILSWFLSQNKEVKGFKKAIFSGVTALEFGRIISEFIIPNKKLKGLYHISSEAIDKFSLLYIINKIYNKNIKITEDYKLSIDRSLDSSKFRIESGYTPLEWENAIKIMREFDINNQ